MFPRPLVPYVLKPGFFIQELSPVAVVPMTPRPSMKKASTASFSWTSTNRRRRRQWFFWRNKENPASQGCNSKYKHSEDIEMGAQWKAKNREAAANAKGRIFT